MTTASFAFRAFTRRRSCEAEKKQLAATLIGKSDRSWIDAALQKLGGEMVQKINGRIENAPTSERRHPNVS
jgi:hypothetical protein